MLHSAPIKRALKQLRGKKLWGFASVALLLSMLALSPAALHLEKSTSLPLLFELRGTRPVPAGFWLVALNHRAHQTLGLPPPARHWPRSVFAELINRLHSAGARLIVMDVSFKEPRDAPGDQLLAEAIKNAGNVVLFTYLQREQINTGNGLLDLEQAHPPLPLFAEHALGSGSFTLPKVHQVVSTGLADHAGVVVSQPRLVAQLLHGSLQLTPAQLRTYYINYYGPAQSFPVLNADQLLLAQATELAKLRNAVIYIGALETVQTAQLDTYPTVFSSRHGIDLSGVEISATVAANLFEGSGIRPLAAPLGLIAVLASFALLVGIGLSRWRLLPPICAVALLGFAALAYGLFTRYFIWLPFTMLSITVAAAAVSVFLHQHFSQKQYLLRVQNALRQHLPKHAAEKLSRTLVNLEQEHSLVYGVCVITDIRGYTALAERTKPDRLHDLMNRYYAQLIAAVEQQQGFVGNIVGDSLLAIWTGASITTELCARAMATVTDIQARLQSDAELKRELPTCIAIHAGQFSLGHLGARSHFEYSPVGDMVNTAARVEHFNRTLGTEFLCTAPVALQLQSLATPPCLLYLGEFTMRNRSEATALYSVCPDAATRQQFGEALAAYQQHDLPRAQQLFGQLAQHQAHGPSQYYLDQLAQLPPHHA